MASLEELARIAEIEFSDIVTTISPTPNGNMFPLTHTIFMTALRTM
ncbi:MAG: hypothetical protein KKC23_06295 [Proteobacteria bacterium]|nr:hypothetical protein [Pseudomonadota bacterium]